MTSSHAAVIARLGQKPNTLKAVAYAKRPPAAAKAAEAVAAAFVSYQRLRARGKDPARKFPAMMAACAVRHVRDGRCVGGRRSSKDVLSWRTQVRHGFRVERLPTDHARRR